MAEKYVSECSKYIVRMAKQRVMSEKDEQGMYNSEKSQKFWLMCTLLE